MTVEDDSLYRGYYKYEKWDHREDRYVLVEGYVGPFTTVGPVKGALNNEISDSYGWSRTNYPNIIHAVELQKCNGWNVERVFPNSYPV